MTSLLPPAEVAALEAAPFTYPEVGATADGAPPGYRAHGRSRRLHGVDLRAAADRLLTWGVHEAAGLTVAASARRLGAGTVVRLSLGVGRLRLQAPCRVVYVVDEPGRAGFAYGTLPGHPESGEQRFLLEQAADGTLTFSVTSFSRPAGALARAGGPVARRVQDVMASRYVAALDA
ncbi:DUF1990 family protein [Puerhibacterium puerhi]|uniref:DUF1990 family protein n=1 Tax=Puerhibacterium puerhi TaxID=2692623 RepID=UPI0013572961|nr:DUF1990 domain-containing protein [Puerhibacterium puerhi]